MLSHEDRAKLVEVKCQQVEQLWLSIKNSMCQVTLFEQGYLEWHKFWGKPCGADM